MTDKPKKKWKLPLLILGVVIAIIALLFLTKPSPPKVASTEKAWLVDAEPVLLSANHPELSLLGTVTSPFDTQLSAVIQADVDQVPVREGDTVSKGQILIELDQSDIQSLVIQRTADLNELDALIKAEQNRFNSDQRSLKDEQRLLQVSRDALARQQRLKSSNLIAQERLEQAESQVSQSSLAVTAREQAINDHPNRLNQLKSRRQRAKSLLDNALRDLERSDVRAPFDGIITRVSVSPGERVQVGQALASLYDANQVEVRAQLPDKYLAIVRAAFMAGDEIRARANYLGTVLDFKLTRLSGQTNASSGGVDAFFQPIDRQLPLLLNSTVRLQATLPALEQTFTLPVSAIYGTQRIYRIDDDRIQAHPIEVVGRQLDSQGRSRMIIRQGSLNQGDLIVTTQLPNAITGLKIELRQNTGEKTGKNTGADAGKNTDERTRDKTRKSTDTTPISYSQVNPDEPIDSPEFDRGE